MTRYFKVQKGYGDDDYISIDETELRKAMIAQVKGQVAIFKEGTVAGNSIISILPDWNRTMGWKRDYKLVGEDYDHVGRKRIDESRLLMEDTLNEALGRPAAPRIEGSDDLAAGLASKFRIS